MKKLCFWGFTLTVLVVLCGLISCTNEDKTFMNEEPVSVNAGDVVKGISVSLSDFTAADAQTRTAYSANGLNVTWASNDTIGIFPNKGGQVEFPIEAGTESNQATFDGGGWALRADNTYSAYYPYSAKNSYYNNQTIQLSYTGQKQTANGNTTHLGKYDYQATSGVKTNSSGYLNFQFKHMGALMVFNLTVPKAGTYTSLTLTSSEKVFVTKATLDISGSEPALKSLSKSNTFTLNLGNIELTSDNSVLTAYMMLAPADLSKGSLELTIDGDRIFTTSLTGQDVEAGKQYNIEKAFVDDTPSPDEIIAFADENVKAICIQNWDTNKDGELSYEEASAVTDIGNKFYAKTKIKSFDEFQHFTGITSVQDEAFKSCISLESIVLPASLQATSNYMFDGCGKLKSVTNTEGLEGFGEYTFNNCPSLKEITLPSSLASIGWYAFAGGGFTSIKVPKSVTSIGGGAFQNCSSLTSIEIPEGVTSIGEGAFRDCSNLTSIEIPEGVTSIGSYAFYNCSKLTSVVIPEGVTSIGELAFDNCSSLTSIEIPEGVTSIGVWAFENCSSLTSIVIPEGVTLIDGSAFYNCSSLTSIEIPEGVTSIGGSAFEGCCSLTSIVIPESVTSIGTAAFAICSSLTSITIPEGMTSIGSYAFQDCSSLNSFTCLATNPPSFDGYLLYMDEEIGESKYSGPIYVPAASVDDYKAADGWSQYASQIKAIPE